MHEICEKEKAMRKIRRIAALLAAALMAACGGGSPGYTPNPVLVQYVAGYERNGS
jgi:hypothetical protein